LILIRLKYIFGPIALKMVNFSPIFSIAQTEYLYFSKECNLVQQLLPH